MLLSVVSPLARKSRKRRSKSAWRRSRRSSSSINNQVSENYRNQLFSCTRHDEHAYIAAPATLTNVVGNGKDLHTPANIAEMAALSGMPADQAKRVVVIAQRQLKALQSGQRLAHQWQITWKHTERWSNPLMGWTSTADPMSNVKLSFETKEAAIAFAERNGWKFEVKAETSKTNTTPGTYLYKHNFLDKRVSFAPSCLAKYDYHVYFAVIDGC